MAQERVFPIFLDGAIQSISTGTVAWNGETSRILCTGACTVTVGSGDVPGTLLSIGVNAAATVTINVGHADGVGPFGDDATLDTVTLNSAGEVVTLMWSGSEWFYMGATETIAVS
jgi:hypothetical protein